MHWIVFLFPFSFALVKYIITMSARTHNVYNLQVDMSKPYAIIGPIVHSRELKKIEILDNHVIVIVAGKIVHLGKAVDKKELNTKYGVTEDQIKNLVPGQFIMPGLIDTHIHAPQYPNTGLGYDKTLLDWLEQYTFPLEKQYSKEYFARKVYKKVVQHSLDCGTTTASYFATIHLKSSMVLADVMKELGQRGFVGKVNMNTNDDEQYNETTEQSMLDTENFIKKIKAGQYTDLVHPIITPRFALSCDMELMKKLANLATNSDVHIQTHISENKLEISAVKELFNKQYAEVYDEAGLLTSKTILAHGVWLEDAELKILSARGTSVAHCPSSNTNLRSGLCNVRRLLAAGVKVGLGTDVSGGEAPSILGIMRDAISTSIHVSFHETNIEPLTYQEAFFLATLGGAEALSLDHKVGNFIEEKEFDAIIVDMSNQFLLNATTEALVQKFVYTGDDRNISSVFVAGKQVK